MAALLDTIGIEKVVVHGISGGGPLAIQFSVRHPEKCNALILECAISGEFVHPKAAELTSAGGRWFM